MKKQEHIYILFTKYLEKRCTDAELDEILRYFQLEEYDEQLIHLIEEELDREIEVDDLVIKSIGDGIADRLFTHTRPQTSFNLRRWIPYAAAAILAFFAVAATVYYISSAALKGDRLVATEEVVLPGNSRATITLSDGQVLTLSEEHEGVINTGNLLIYTDGSTIKTLEENQLVVLTTPRAGQYAITLSDGTRVWLNAASQLVYPTRFESNERNVQVKGEAYFEVAHDPNRPFIVHTEGQRIKVLGTRFNIHAYGNGKNQHTTLAEGSIEVQPVGGEGRVRLEPGQQAISKGDGADLSITHVDPYEYTSWKDGVIALHGYELGEIINQLERWYDVDFGEVPEGIKSDKLYGMIRRDVPLNDVLQTLRDNYKNIQFEINGRRVTMSRP